MKINHAIISVVVLGCILLGSATVKADPQSDRRQECQHRCDVAQRDCVATTGKGDACATQHFHCYSTCK